MEFPDRIVVNVTREDLRDGEPHFSQSCPIYLAVSREYPGFEVGVNDPPHAGTGGIRLSQGWHNAYYPSNKAFSTMIGKIDCPSLNGSPEPSQFVMERGEKWATI